MRERDAGMNQTLSTIEELLRIPAPCPAPMGLACDGTDLWIGSFATNRIYGLRAQRGTGFEGAHAPEGARQRQRRPVHPPVHHGEGLQVRGDPVPRSHGVVPGLRRRPALL